MAELGQLSAITVITRHSHFLIISYRAHHISAQPQQLVRWPSGGEGCTVVAGGGGGPSLVPGSALPADCYVLQLRSALLSSQFSGLVTRHHRHHRPATAKQPVVSAAATSSTIFQLESRPNLYHCVNSVINQPRSERRLAVDDNVPL